MVSDRGQLLLIGAVVIGVTVLSTVVLLNGMQYASEAGSQAETDELDRAERMEAMVERDLNRLVTEVLESSWSDPDAALRENITVYANYSRNMSLSRGTSSLNVTYNESKTEDGGEISRNGVNLQSELHGGNKLEGIEYLKQLTVTVNDYTSATNGEFVVDVKDVSGNSWMLRVEQTGAGYEVITDPPSDPQMTECSVSSSSVDLQLVEGTGDCEIRGIRETMGTVESVEFRGNGRPRGDYAIRYADANDAGYGASSYPARPAATLRYRGEDLSYNRTFLLNGTGGLP